MRLGRFILVIIMLAFVIVIMFKVKNLNKRNHNGKYLLSFIKVNILYSLVFIFSRLIPVIFIVYKREHICYIYGA